MLMVRYVCLTVVANADNLQRRWLVAATPEQ
jgi:hypothetical protein